MTLGEKIRHARKCSGMSQEQLAERMCVSRSAIAKWETDKGMPDIENLKLLSRLLGISTDSLLDDSGVPGSTVIRMECRPAAYGRGCEKVRKDRLMRARFPQAGIWTLLGRPDLTRGTVDSARGFLTPDPFGEPEFLKSVRQLDRAFYLVEQEDSCYFVSVTEEYMEIRPLGQGFSGNTFQLGSWSFIRGSALPKE